MSKDEFLIALNNEGYDADYRDNNVPTVFIEDALMIGSVNKAIKRLIKEYGYNQSYGISLRPQLQSA